MIAQTTSSVNAPSQAFNLVGPIQNFTLAAGGILSGGTITVNGVTVQIPTNTVVTMPTGFLTVNQIFRGTTQGAVPAVNSGLALNDPAAVRRPGGFQVEIVGNTMESGSTRNYYAGLVRISPDALQTSDGFIRKIDYVAGELCVGANATPLLAAPCPATDTKVRLNDPTGKFGLLQASPDRRFTVDTENATVTANTGYPMCIPRVAPPTVDANCPIGNRPVNLLVQFVTTFAMNGLDYPGAGIQPFIRSCNNIPNIGGSPTTATRCAPTKQAPLVVGDYISFQGILTSNVPGSFVSAFSIVANVGIFTQKYAENIAAPVSTSEHRRNYVKF